MYRNILIPISDRHTVKKLVSELKSLDGHLLDGGITLLYVQTLVYNTALGMDAVVVTPNAECEGRLILQQARDSLARMNFSCRTVFKTGSPVAEISQYAENHQVDLIVVCRHQKGLLANLLFTQLSDELVEKASTHVLVLK